MLLRHRWIPFIVPFLVFMLAGELLENRLGLPYPQAYAIRIALTVLSVAFVWPGLRQFSFRIHPLAIVVGIVGVALWVGICRLGLEARLLVPIGLGRFVGAGERVGFNPFEYFGGQTVWLVAFLLTRFIGLAVVVPIIEEFFLRGFVMRYVIQYEWWNLPFRDATLKSLIIVTVFAALGHPAELFAAVVWFSMVSWLMIRTGKIWDCIIAHATTNFLLGIYVLATGHWELW